MAKIIARHGLAKWPGSCSRVDGEANTREAADTVLP
jgi:hypothetical protein